MTTSEKVQQICDADKRRRTSALRDASMYISIQEAIDAEIDYRLGVTGEALIKVMQDGDYDNSR